MSKINISTPMPITFPPCPKCKPGVITFTGLHLVCNECNTRYTNVFFTQGR